MKNKVLKNVVLFACILGLVLFQVTFIFATDYNYTSISNFCSDVNTALNWSGTYITSTVFLDTIPNEFYPVYTDMLDHYDLSDSDIICAVLSDYYRNQRWYYVRIYVTNDNNSMVSSYPNNLDSSSVAPNIYSTFENTGVMYYEAYTGTSDTSIYYNTSSTFNSTSVNILGTYTGKYNFYGIYPVQFNFSLTSSLTDKYILEYVDPLQPGTGYPYEAFINPLVPSDVTSPVSSSMPFTWYIYQSSMNDPNYDPSDAWQHFRYMVGTFPAMWEYYFRWFSNLSLGKMDDIASSLSEMVVMSENIQDIADRLSLAFPDDQAELNDSIAETLLDDTNDTGLTAEKVSNAKSDFDDGISTYEIDTSGSAYSTPFAAIRGGDWSFWSQTTLDNMGSGYSYNYQQTRNTKASNDSDIYEENYNSLFKLLGW